VTLDNIQPTASGLQKVRPARAWLEFLGNTVSTGVYTSFEGFNNDSYGLVYTTIETSPYLGSRLRFFAPPAFTSPATRCFFRYGDTTFSGGTSEVREPIANKGWIVPAMQATWTLQDGVYVYVQGAVTGVVNFVPPGSPNATPLPRFAWRDQSGNLEIVTAGGFFFEAGFALSSLVDTRRFTAQTATNLFESTSPGTTYEWQYDITVSMQ
jgi:hypothetical protein